MKFKTTKKELINGIPSNYLFSCGFCSMQNLLYYENPIAYTCGVYGWNFDVFKIDNYYITTGYRGMIGKPIKNLTIYETQAEKIINDRNLTYEEKKEKVTELLHKCIKESSIDG